MGVDFLFMKILAIETATEIFSVAILDETKVLAEQNLNLGAKHSSHLITVIDNLLKYINIDVAQLDGFAVGTGPGSFTGIRVGISCAKGLSYANKKPLVGISTLDGIAYNLIDKNRLICPVIDAKRNLIYTAVYTADFKNLTRKTGYMATTIEKLKKIIKKEVIFTGNDIEKYDSEVKKIFRKKAVFAPCHLRYPRAANIGLLALKKMKNIKNNNQVEPVYIREPEVN